MKTKIYLLVIAAVVMLNFSSCKKEGHGRDGFGNSAPDINVVINASVKAGNTYRLNLNNYSTGNTVITTQAAHYTISQVIKDANSNNIYEYVSSLNPKDGNTADKVVLKINPVHESNGGCHNNAGGSSKSAKNITISFTVN